MIDITLRDVPLRVCPTNGWVFKHAATGTWEAGTYDVLDRYLTPETTVLDIGAWVGPITLYAAAKAKQVYSFEPDPVAFATLAANIAANGCTNVQAFNRAIALQDGTIQLGVRVKPGDSTSSILADTGDSWLVDCQRLETFFARHPITGPLLLKIDVEGYEYQLLPSLTKMLQGREFVLHLSTHPHIIEQSVSPTERFAGLRRSLARRKAHVKLGRALNAFEVRTADAAARRLSFVRKQRESWFGDLLTADRDRVVIGRAA